MSIIVSSVMIYREFAMNPAAVPLSRVGEGEIESLTGELIPMATLPFRSRWKYTEWAPLINEDVNSFFTHFFPPNKSTTLINLPRGAYLFLKRPHLPKAIVLIKIIRNEAN